MSTKPSPKKSNDGGAPKAVSSKPKTTTAGPRASFAMGIAHDAKPDGKVLKPTQKSNSTVKSSKTASADPFALALPPVPNDGSELLAEVPPHVTRIA